MKVMLVALLRGINVGKAKRVAMADLRATLSELGYSDVQSVLNSGNLVFRAEGGDQREIAHRISDEVESKHGVSSDVVVISAEELLKLVDGNPLRNSDRDDSKLLAAFLFDPSDTTRLKPLLETDWTPEEISLGDRVAYLWCPEGVLKSALPATVSRSLDDAVTVRNWRTVLRIRDKIQSA